MGLRLASLDFRSVGGYACTGRGEKGALDAKADCSILEARRPLWGVLGVAKEYSGRGLRAVSRESARVSKGEASTQDFLVDSIRAYP